MTTYRYKLTDKNGFTYNETEWEPGKSYETSGKGRLCSENWLHCYTDPLLAVMLNPIHARFTNPKMCLVAVSGECKNDYGLKEGWSKMTFVKWIKVPKVTKTQKIAFGILCAKEVYKEPEWNKWADKWLSGEDRSKKSAAVACAAAYSYFSRDGSSAAAYAAHVRDVAVAACAAVDASEVAVLDLPVLAKTAMKIK